MIYFDNNAFSDANHVKNYVNYCIAELRCVNMYEQDFSRKVANYIKIRYYNEFLNDIELSRKEGI